MQPQTDTISYPACPSLALGQESAPAGALLSYLGMNFDAIERKGWVGRLSLKLNSNLYLPTNSMVQILSKFRYPR